MKIGLRTIKTAISATLAMLVADYFNLLYPASAGIIAVLSVANTKKTSLTTGIYRLLSLALATVIAFFCFTLFGYNPLAFGIYLLLFIPSAVYFHLSEGIVVSSVLVTQYLIEKRMSLEIIGNEFLLMIIGVSFALILNSYMPNTEKQLKLNQKDIENTFREMLTNMAIYLNQHHKERDLMDRCTSLKALIQSGETLAKRNFENQLLSSNNYYLNYFSMRRMQSSLLRDMLNIVEKITIDKEQVSNIQNLFEFTAQNFAEANDGKEILERIALVYTSYRKKDLPKTREEFENRAQLFQLLQIFQSFIELKADFSQQQKSRN